MSTTITTHQEDGTVVVRPGCDVVAAAVPELRAALRVAATESAGELVVDLSAVTMVDSAGIGLLISAHNSMRKSGGHLSVIHVSADIFDLFRSMRIHQHFSVSGN
jgi:anti-anti-sigma factor